MSAAQVRRVNQKEGDLDRLEPLSASVRLFYSETSILHRLLFSINLAYGRCMNASSKPLRAERQRSVSPMSPRAWKVTGAVGQTLNESTTEELLTVLAPLLPGPHGEGATVVAVIAVTVDADTGPNLADPSDRSASPPTGTPARPLHTALSKREMDVLRLLADGKTNQQIAASLVIALPTVARHVANIYSKLGASNRADATACAFRLSLIA